MTFSPVGSPKRFVEINYSTIGEKSDFLAASPKLDRSVRDQQRLKWMTLVLKHRKLHDMQPVFNYLKDESSASKVRQFHLRVIFNRFHRIVRQRRWRRLMSQRYDQHRIESFLNRQKRVREIRAKQTARYIQTSPEYLPDFSFLVPPAYSSDEIRKLRGNGSELDAINKENTDIEDIKERGIELNGMKGFFRKEAIILYLVAFLLGACIGIIFYKKIHRPLYNYLKLRRNYIYQMPIDNESILANATGPNQDILFEQIGEPIIEQFENETNDVI